MTVFRALKSHGYYTSFNHNARYYALCGTPRFDAHGLWFYRSIGFSRHRTLPATLVALVLESSAGASADELANLLARLAQQSLLARSALGRQTIYLAPDASRQEPQWQRRCQPDPVPTAPAVLPNHLPVPLVLAVLVEWIRSPAASPRQLCRVLQTKGLAPLPQQVEDIADHFLLKKIGHFEGRRNTSSRPRCERRAVASDRGSPSGGRLHLRPTSRGMPGRSGVTAGAQNTTAGRGQPAVRQHSLPRGTSSG
jgi:hypothetical protein